jgi:hypothetical protein
MVHVVITSRNYFCDPTSLSHLFLLDLIRLMILNPVKAFDFFSSSSTRHGGAWGERRYSSYSFTTSVLDGGEWSASRPGRALPPGKGPSVPIVQEAGWASEPVWTQRIEEKSFAPAEYRTSISRSSSQ